MQRLKKLYLVLSLLIFAASATGCIEAEVGFELNKDNTGSLYLNTAMDADAIAQLESLSTDEETSENTEQDMLAGFAEMSEEMQSEFEELGLEGAEMKVSPLEYEIDGTKYIGNTTQIDFTDKDDFAEKYGEDSFKIIDLGNGKKRFEIYLDNSLEDSSLSEDEISQVLSSWEDYESLGIKFTYTLKTNYKVTEHNADSSHSALYNYTFYTWDLFEQLAKQGSSAILFIEYEDTGAEEAKESEVMPADIAVMRSTVDKNIGISLDDKDFHGKMLQEFSILKGTNNGLELDRGLTRTEGAAVYARLLGIEKEIETFNEQYPDYDTGFKDIPGWVEPTINYLHYKGLVNGISGDQYGSSLDMTETQFTTLVLRALGFSDKNGDFSWSASDAKAKEIGLYSYDTISPDKIMGDVFTRRDMSYIAYNALYFQNINTGDALIEKFMQEKFDWALTE